MKKILKYQCLDLSKALIVYYLVVVFIITIASIGINTTHNADMNGIGFTSEVFCFIVGLCLFREYFYLFMQNEVPRKHIFMGAFLTLCILSLIISFMDTLFLNILNMIPVINMHYITLSSSLYSNFITMTNPVISVFINLIITFLITLIFFSVGYLISVLFYLSAKPAKILIAVGLPLLVVGGIPIIMVRFPDVFSALFSCLLTILGISSCNPFIGIVSLSIGILIINFFNYLLVHRAEI